MLDLHRAASQLSNSHKPPRDFKYTQSIVQHPSTLPSVNGSQQKITVVNRSRNSALSGTQSQEDKKTFSSASSIAAFKEGNTINFDRTQNLLKLNLRPSVGSVQEEKDIGIASSKNKKFIQKIVFKHNRDNSVASSGNGQIPQTEQIVSSKVAYLNPSQFPNS